MTKGMNYRPSSVKDGNWFYHSVTTEDVSSVASARATAKNTVSVPENTISPPNVYRHREKALNSVSNPYSSHDNRHSIQCKGEYLGNGCDTRYFGRRLHPIDQRMHHTDVSFLYQTSPGIQTNYSPTTASAYKDPGLIQPLTRRRFPKKYHNAESSDPTNGTLSTSSSSTRTPLYILAMSQQPLLPPNKWKYSYHGDYKVYPPYHTNKSPSLPNILMGYGQSFYSRPAS